MVDFTPAAEFAAAFDAVSAKAAFDQVTQEYKSGDIGYYSLPENSLAIIEKVNKATSTYPVLKEMENIVVIGIGGSSLGAKAVDSLLRHKHPQNKKIVFFENSDPVNISEHLSAIKKENSVIIVISKSGSTIETTSIFKTIIHALNIDLNSDDAHKVIAITDEGSVLSEFASSHQMMQFHIPHNVGGRFSVLSAVGIVPLMLAGYDVNTLLKGAGDFRDSFFGGKENHLLQKAYFLYSKHHDHTANVLFSYSNALENLSKWYVQLWGESLGKVNKEGKNVGLTPIGLTGSVDQHSFLQLIIEGPKNKTVTFMNIDDFENGLSIPNVSLKHIEKTDYINGRTFNELINAQCDATRESVIHVGVPSDKITLDCVSEVNVGTLIMYYEILTSLVCALLGVNTYNQPGVELGKKILVEKFKN